MRVQGTPTTRQHIYNYLLCKQAVFTDTGEYVHFDMKTKIQAATALKLSTHPKESVAWAGTSRLSCVSGCPLQSCWLHFNPVIPELRTHPRVAFRGRRRPCPPQRERVARGRINWTHHSLPWCICMLLLSSAEYISHTIYIKTNTMYMWASTFVHSYKASKQQSQELADENTDIMLMTMWHWICSVVVLCCGSPSDQSTVIKLISVNPPAVTLPLSCSWTA